MHQGRPCFLTLAAMASLLLGANFVASPASAATIVYHFTGDVTQIQEQVEPLFGTDESAVSMSGSMSVTMTDTNVLDPYTGSYAVTNFSVTVGTHNYTLAGPFSGVEIKTGPPGQDQFNLTVPNPVGDPIPADPPPPPTHDAVPASEFSIKLHADGDIGPFSNDGLPTTIPSLSSFNLKNEWRLVFGPGEGQRISGTLTTLTAVPLPASVILFGAGLVALIGLGMSRGGLLARGWRFAGLARG